VPARLHRFFLSVNQDIHHGHKEASAKGGPIRMVDAGSNQVELDLSPNPCRMRRPKGGCSNALRMWVDEDNPVFVCFGSEDFLLLALIGRTHCHFDNNGTEKLELIALFNCRRWLRNVIVIESALFC
jgi:hypothetical protein